MRIFWVKTTDCIIWLMIKQMWWGYHLKWHISWIRFLHCICTKMFIEIFSNQRSCKQSNSRISYYHIHNTWKLGLFSPVCKNKNIWPESIFSLPTYCTRSHLHFCRLALAIWASNRSPAWHHHSGCPITILRAALKAERAFVVGAVRERVFINNISKPSESSSERVSMMVVISAGCKDWHLQVAMLSHAGTHVTNMALSSGNNCSNCQAVFARKVSKVSFVTLLIDRYGVVNETYICRNRKCHVCFLNAVHVPDAYSWYATCCSAKGMPGPDIVPYLIYEDAVGHHSVFHEPLCIFLV